MRRGWRKSEGPGADGYALVGIAYLEIGCGSQRAVVTDGSIILVLRAAVIADMIEKVDHMAGSTSPCHSYIDLSDLTVIVSVGEARSLV